MFYKKLRVSLVYLNFYKKNEYRDARTINTFKKAKKEHIWRRVSEDSSRGSGSIRLIFTSHNTCSRGWEVGLTVPGLSRQGGWPVVAPPLLLFLSQINQSLNSSQVALLHDRKTIRYKGRGVVYIYPYHTTMIRQQLFKQWKYSQIPRNAFLPQI